MFLLEIGTLDIGRYPAANTSMPQTVIDPRSGFSNPTTIRNVVVLLAPLGPNNV
jgi:hypothetical protein